MTKETIFREKAISSMSAPEKLDERIKLVPVRLWVGLIVVSVTILIASIWGFWGRIDSKVNGEGIFMNEGGIRAVSAHVSGSIKYINVYEGSDVEQNEVLGVLNEPILELEIFQLIDKFILLDNQFNEFMKDTKASLTIRNDYYKKIEGISSTEIERLEEIQKNLGEISNIYKSLKEKGITSKVEFYQILQNSITADVNVTEQKGSKYKIPVDNYDFLSTKNNEVREKLKEMKLTQDDLGLKRAEFIKKSIISSPVAGKVVSVLKRAGDNVLPGQDIFIIAPKSTDSLLLTAYFSIKDWKKILPNQLVYISPTELPPQDYGYMLGIVRHVGSYPATDEALEASYKNKNIAKYLKRGEDSVVPVEIELVPDSQNLTGIKWTCLPTLDRKITMASPCNVMVVVKQSSPASYVLPWLKKNLFGVGANLPSDKATSL